MTVFFSDDFNRADGAVGNGWTAAGSVAISGNRLYTTSSGRITRLKATPGNDVQLTWKWPQFADNSGGIALLRSDAGLTNAYQVGFVLHPAYIVATLYVKTTAGGTVAITRALSYACDPSAAVFAFKAEGSLISFSVNGTTILLVKDTTVESGETTHYQCTGGTVYLDDWTEGTPPFPLLAVPYGSQPPNEEQTVELTSPYANWTPGSPGAPTFTISAGTIVSQEVIDASTARITYLPPEAEARIVIHDPDNDLTVNYGIAAGYVPLLQAIEDAGGQGGAGGDFTEEQAQVISDVAQAWQDVWAALPEIPAAPKAAVPQPRLSGTEPWYLKALEYAVPGIEWLYNQSLNLPDMDTLATALAEIELVLGHYVEGQESFRSIFTRWDETLPAINPNVLSVLGKLDTLTDADQKNLLWVVNQITGGFGDDVRGVVALLNALTNNGANDLDSLLLALSDLHDYVGTEATGVVTTLRGAEGYTLKTIQDNDDANLTVVQSGLADLADQIAAVRGAGSPDLAGVVSAIAAVRGEGSPDLHAILDAIAALEIPPAVDLSPVLTAIANLSTQLDAGVDSLTDQIADLTAEVANALSDVLNAISALRTRLDLAVPPIWRGSANMTLGNVVGFDGPTYLQTPMIGCLAEITTWPHDATSQGVNPVRMFYRAGMWAFTNEYGYAEPWNYFTYKKGQLFPNSMSQAAGLMIKCPAGYQGTLRPILGYA